MMMKSRISAAVSSFLSTIIIILIEDSPKFMNSLKIKYLWILCTILFSLLPNIFSTKGHGGIHQCIHGKYILSFSIIVLVIILDLTQ